MSKQKESTVQASTNVESSRVGHGLSVLALLVAIAALAGSGWLLWQNEIDKQLNSANLRVSLSEITGKLDLLDASVGALQQEQSELINENQLDIVLTKALDPVSDRQTLLDEALNKLRDANVNRRDTVLLEDAEQLLGMAARSASINKDAKGAELALLQADAIFAELSDARLAPIRSALGNDLQALRSVKLPDVELVASRLSGLILTISELPLVNEPKATDSVVQTDQSSTPDSSPGWRGVLDDLFSDLKGMIQIQKMDQQATPLLAPEQRYFLDLNLQLILQRANLAVWQRAPEQVQRDLDEATVWTRRYFDINDVKVQSFLDALQELQGEQLDVELPDLAGAYSALKVFRAEERSQ